MQERITAPLQRLFNRGELPERVQVIGPKPDMLALAVGSVLVWDPDMQSFALEGGQLFFMAYEIRRRWGIVYGPAQEHAEQMEFV